MKKFILSLVFLVSGLIGIAICLSRGSVIKSIHTITGSTDSMVHYYYKLSDTASYGLLFFGLITIIGLIFSIISVRK